VKSLKRWLKTIDWRSSGKWTALSVLVGVIAGCGSIAFQTLGQIVTHYSLAQFAGYAPLEAAGEHGLFDHSHLGMPNAWMIIPVMIVGGLASGWLVYTFAPEAEGHGTDAAIDAFHNKRGRIRGRIPLVKTIASALTLGTGGSGGREGPIAQIGASFGSFLGTVLNLPARDRRILLAAGVGAGVGAIFRAPLAGALFAAEILYSESDLETEVVVPAATASIISYTVYTLWLPADVRHLPLFGEGLKHYSWHSPLELVLYLLLSVVLVPWVAFYVTTFYGTQKLFTKIPVPKMFRPAIGAGLAGLTGVGLYQLWGQDRAALAVLSTGYGTLQNALSHADMVGIGLLFAVAAVKVITTSLTISSGGSGGVFGPSMIIGGCVGSATGLAFQYFWPELVPQPETFGLVGMAGFFSGCAHAPFSTIIMVSEITGSYGLLLPAMWVSTLTFLMCQQWKLYTRQVRTRLESPAHRGDFLVDVLEGLHVNDVYKRRNDILTVSENATLEEIVHLLAATQQHFFPVVDSDGKIQGIFSEDDVRAYLYDETLWKLANARDVMSHRMISVTPEDDLATAMRCFTIIALDEIPVVDSRDSGKLLGTLRHQEAIAAYNRRVMEFKQAADDDAA